MENSIAHYFEKHLSDKNANGYSIVYDELFEHHRNNPITLLEIGIGTLHHSNSNMQFWKDTHQEYKPGASLRAFNEYFRDGMIYGIDTQIDCMINEKGIYTFLFNSTIKELCDHYFKNIKLDFIIDDGDHYWESQIKTFENFFDKLKIGGVYILEDLAYPLEIKKYFEKSDYDYAIRNGLVIIRKNK